MLAASWVVALLSVALAAGVTLTHPLQLRGRRALPEQAWLTVQHTMYLDYRWTGIVLEPLSTASTIALAIMVRNRTTLFWLCLSAAVCVIAAQVVYFTVTERVNQHYAAWTPNSLPPNWADLRQRWEISHIVRTGLFVAAFVLLTVAVVLD